MPTAKSLQTAKITALCGLLACGGASGDDGASSDSSSTGEADASSSTGSSSTGEADASSSTGSITTGGATTGEPAVCGDGEIAGDEVCDDGPDNGVGGSCKTDCTGLRVASVQGDAIPFDKGPDGRISGATVSILEFPDMQVVTAADGQFRFDNLPVGADITLVLEHPDYHPIQTGTHVLPDEGLERLTFQAVNHGIYEALAAIVEVTPDDTKYCQMVTTVTRVGKSIYDAGAHGEAGVVITLDPPLPAENGPVYFNAMVLPDKSLTETSEDGGVLFSQVPPGEYRWTASKAGATFREVRMKCRIGYLINASPPWGLQRL